MLRDQLVASRDTKDLGIIVVGNKRDLLPEELSDPRDYSSAVRKHWKVPYLEVSAKYNWHIVAAFKEVLMTLQEARGHKDLRIRSRNELHEATEHSKCTIL